MDDLSNIALVKVKNKNAYTLQKLWVRSENQKTIVCNAQGYKSEDWAGWLLSRALDITIKENL